MKLSFFFFVLMLSAQSFANATFVKDNRSSGGKKIVLSIKEVGRTGLFRAMLISTNKRGLSTVEVDEGELECEFTSARGSLRSVYCHNDFLRLDGPKTEIFVKRADRAAKYSAQMSKTILSRTTGQETHSTTTIARDLEKTETFIVLRRGH